MAETKELKTVKLTSMEEVGFFHLIREFDKLAKESGGAEVDKHILYSGLYPLIELHFRNHNITECTTYTADDVLNAISKAFHATKWEKVWLNLTTLIDNCADPNADTLEFNERIQKGFALLDSQPEPSAPLTAKLAAVLKSHGIEDGVDAIAESLSKTVMGCCRGGNQTFDAVANTTECTVLESQASEIATAVFEDSFKESVYPHDMHS